MVGIKCRLTLRRCGKHIELEKIILTDDLIDNWTYPLIQPKLIEEAGRRGFI